MLVSRRHRVSAHGTEAAGFDAAQLRRKPARQRLLRKLWRRPKVATGELECFVNFSNQNSPSEVNNVEKDSYIHRYYSYIPDRVLKICERKFAVQYWFYIYTQSSETDLVLKPFSAGAYKELPVDKRLVSIMKQHMVIISLGQLELYKSLPRRIVTVRALSWSHLVSALSDLELRMPEMMKHASYPLMMSANSTQFPCAGNLTHFFHKVTRSP